MHKKIKESLTNYDVALLMLPTGAGKTFLAYRAALQLPGIKNIVIVYPNKNDWKQDCNYIDDLTQASSDDEIRSNISNPWLRDIISPPTNKKPNNFDKMLSEISIHLTTPSMIRKNGGKMITLKKDGTGWNTKQVSNQCVKSLFRKRKVQSVRSSELLQNALIIVDEVHKTPSLLKLIPNYELLNKDLRSHWPKVLFVSATPISSVNTPDFDDDNQTEIVQLIEKKFLSLFTSLLSVSPRTKNLLEKIDNYKDLGETLLEIQSKICIPRNKDSFQNFIPKNIPKDRKTVKKIKEFCINPENYSDCDWVKSIAKLHEMIGLKKIGNKRTNIERQAISKVKCNTKGCIKIDSWSLIKKNIDKDNKLIIEHKLEALSDFIEAHNVKKNGKILIFCSLNNNVRLVSNYLNNKIKVKCENNCTEGKKEKEKAWHTVHRIKDDNKQKVNEILKTFNTNEPCQCGSILVTSNKYSQSIDLHQFTGVVIHYDLDWSPTIMIQRVGRVWRHNNFASKNKRIKENNPIPTYPKVFHLRYPTTVDDEIYVRLFKRFKHLESLKMGLGLIPFTAVVGENLMKVIRTNSPSPPPSASPSPRCRGGSRP